ncbi:unnamed protein product [Ilex paraguariensis]|uniref:Uncharacterized protein n=1 Tax=Ilex paraguariensis TaxID=185542 RepID=A0ABC8RVS7_9AQUA
MSSFAPRISVFGIDLEEGLDVFNSRFKIFSLESFLSAINAITSLYDGVDAEKSVIDTGLSKSSWRTSSLTRSARSHVERTLESRWSKSSLMISRSSMDCGGWRVVCRDECVGREWCPVQDPGPIGKQCICGGDELWLLDR